MTTTNDKNEEARRVWAALSLLPAPEADKSLALSVISRRNDDVLLTGYPLNDVDRLTFESHLKKAYDFYNKTIRAYAVNTLTNKRIAENFYTILSGED